MSWPIGLILIIWHTSPIFTSSFSDFLANNSVFQIEHLFPDFAQRFLLVLFEIAIEIQFFQLVPNAPRLWCVISKI